MSGNPFAPIHVMVVDDSAVVRQSLLAVLSTVAEMTVETAADPIIALGKMHEHWPDVVVLDLEMPRMSGLAFLRQLMRDHPLPIVICSSHIDGSSETARRFVSAGAADVVEKPRLGLRDFLNDSAMTLIDAIRDAAMLNQPRALQVDANDLLSRKN